MFDASVFFWIATLWTGWVLECDAALLRAGREGEVGGGAEREVESVFCFCSFPFPIMRTQKITDGRMG